MKGGRVDPAGQGVGNDDFAKQADDDERETARQRLVVHDPRPGQFGQKRAGPLDRAGGQLGEVGHVQGEVHQAGRGRQLAPAHVQ